MTNELFNLELINVKLTLTFIKRDINYADDIKYFDNVFFDSIKGQELCIKGRSPIEIYVYAVYWCIKKGCKAICIEEFNLSQNFEIYREGVYYPDIPAEWCSIQNSDNTTVLSILSPDSDDKRWSPDFIKQNALTFRLKGIPQTLILTGRGSLLFYSILASSAAVSEYSNVYIDKPTEIALLRISGEMQLSPSTNTKGTVIGVLGDPNCGKSVFSKVFGCLIEKKNKKSVWVYDCDASAPTSDWYIFGLQQAKNDIDTSAIKIARDSIKQKWSEELERKVADCLKTIKTHLDIIVADFPGGLHKDEENLHKRIPDAGRVEMLKCCDRYIILGRFDKPEIIDAWKTELKKYQLEDKIIAEILSKAPDSLPSVEDDYFDPQGVFHAVVSGLDRQHPRADIINALYPYFENFVNF